MTNIECEGCKLEKEKVLDCETFQESPERSTFPCWQKLAENVPARCVRCDFGELNSTNILDCRVRRRRKKDWILPCRSVYNSIKQRNRRYGGQAGKTTVLG